MWTYKTTTHYRAKPRAPKILIIGYTGAGKTTFGNVLAHELGTKCINSGDVIAEDYAELHWKDSGIWESKQHLYEVLLGVGTKGENREKLFNHGIALETPDASTVMRMCLERGNIVTGMRRKAEYVASSHLFDLIIWVEHDDAIQGDTDELGAPDADYEVWAGFGFIAELRNKAQRLGRLLGKDT